MDIATPTTPSFFGPTAAGGFQQQPQEQTMNPNWEIGGDKGSSGATWTIVVAILIFLVLIGVIFIIVYATPKPSGADGSGSESHSTSADASGIARGGGSDQGQDSFRLIGPAANLHPAEAIRQMTTQDGFVELRPETIAESQRPRTDALSVVRQRGICLRCSVPAGLPGVDTDPADQPIYWQLVRTRPDQNIVVIRDDLLCGGMKTRVLERTLKEDYPADVVEYVYASLPFGYEQITLAYTINRLNANRPAGTRAKQAVLFLHKGQQAGSNQDSVLARQLGAKIVHVPLDKDVATAAANYATQLGTEKRVLLAQGFKSPSLVRNIGQIANKIRNKFGQFDEAYSSVGSGALMLGLQEGQVAKNYFGVCVYGPSECPTGQLGAARTLHPGIPFQRPVPADQAPPFSSSLHYDAKVWTFLKDRAGNILFYNVL